MRALILTVSLGFATLSGLSGCAFPGVYKLNVQQGNIVTQDMLDKLTPGMTQRQVIFVMGNPVLQNPYQTQRWDYLYTMERRDKVEERYTISLHFDDRGLYQYHTGELPQEGTKVRDDLRSLPQPEQTVNTVKDTEF